MVASRHTLGTGLYSLREAALYARVSPKLLSAWLFGSRHHTAVVRPQYGHGGRIVSFLDLIQALAIREIRQQHRVPLRKIRQAIKHAKTKHGLDYPFARQHVCYLLGDDLVIRPPNDGFVQPSSNGVGQRPFAFVESYLTHLEFSADGLAICYRLFEYNGVTVRINPRLRFGEPLLPSGHTARTIADAVQVEGDVEAAAEVYGLSAVEVEAAVQCFRFLRAKAA